MDEEERLHFHEVLGAFRDYAAWMGAEARRRETHLSALSPAHLALLPPGVLDFRREGTRQAVAANQRVLDLIADAQGEDEFEAIPREEAGPEKGRGGAGGPDAEAAGPSAVPPPVSSAAHFSKVKSTLHQIVRDWSAEGAEERAACYGPIYAELSRHLPVTDANRNAQRVLVPGCGLGRMPFDLALKGYAAQGNEFSYFMLFASHFVLNCVGDLAGSEGREEEEGDAEAAASSLTIHPWVHDPSNHLRPQDMLRPVPFPDLDPNTLLSLNPGADLSMVAGEFLDVYGGARHVGAWDAVVTCFFLDTAPVVFDYIDLIWRILRPGGVWVNLGPLLYHWQDLQGEEEAAAAAARRRRAAEAAAAAAPSPATAASPAPGPADDGSPSSRRNDIDERFFKSVELSYQEVRHAVVAKGFSIVHEAVHRTPYAGNRLSLMKTVFTAMAFTAKKPG